VRDEGPGLPIEMRGRVFEPFATTKSRGTGLGLAITRKIIEAHQGRITLACPPAGGTLVTVSLPREIRRSLPGPVQFFFSSCEEAVRLAKGYAHLRYATTWTEGL